MTLNTSWHFPIMILASLITFLSMMRIVLGKTGFARQLVSVILLSGLVVVIGMCFGRYGAQWGFPWWIYYTVPLAMTLFLPTVVLKLDKKKTTLYIMMSFLSAPFIHFIFSFFLGWLEYMPFIDIPYVGSLF